MTTLRLVLGDQLTRSLTALQGIDPASDRVLLVEVAEETVYVRHHRQKLLLVLSAMRHFAAALAEEGLQVEYVRLEDPENTGNFTGEVRRALVRHRPRRLILTRPGEWRVARMAESWKEGFTIPVEIRDDDRFLVSSEEFAGWARGRKELRMEYFYREMRRRTGWLMNGRQPAGGQWNFDRQNRKALPRSLPVPEARRFPLDSVTREVAELVRRRFPGHFGEIDSFGWAVTRTEARAALDHFVSASLPQFGVYQDAMALGEDFLFHSLLSPYLNLGLLGPREVCEAALEAYARDEAPLSAVEGFIRQILGWREFARGVYWTHMPAYRGTNHFDARRPLPAFYWTGDTPMRCLRETISGIRRNGYAHHIQRLMVTGNFALLAGVAPAEVEDWYLAVFVDAFEWVELPNTHGMALHADGGLLASKPYAASGAYIRRMSDYCAGCRYDARVRLGPKACPFNFLYWNFLIVHAGRLSANPRMAMPYRALLRMRPEEREAISAQASRFLRDLAGGH